ncbi:MAG: hypothetical protein HOV87_23995 [Catenulispora sp.]|nr:hypothetical protein [Catenulispora sp.]
MAAHTAGLRIERRRVEHIRQLMGEIADRQHIAAHLLVTTARAGYYFLALACITAGLVGLADGRDYLVRTWGAAGVGMVLLWIGLKVSERVMGRVVRELRRELARTQPGTAADAASSAEPVAEGTASPVAAVPAPADRRSRLPS